MKELGKLKNIYSPPQGNKYINYAFGGFFLLISLPLMWGLLDGSYIFGIAGILFALLGGGFIYATYTKTKGRALHLHENGFRTMERNQTIENTFDELLGFNILADSNVYVQERTQSGITRKHHAIVGYEYLTPQSKLVIDSRYTNWEEIARQLSEKALPIIVKTYLKDLQAGTKLEFRQLIVGTRDKEIILHVSPKGITFSDTNEFLAWEHITGAEQNKLDLSEWEILTTAGAKSPRKLRYYNFPNAPIIMMLINALKQKP